MHNSRELGLLVYNNGYAKRSLIDDDDDDEVPFVVVSGLRGRRHYKFY